MIQSNQPLRTLPLRLRPLALLVVTAAVSGCAVTPNPLAPEEVADRAREQWQQLAAAAPQQPGVIGVAQAIALAIRHNRDYRVRMMESVLEENQLEVARFDLLPELTSRAGFQRRDKEVSSFSEANGALSSQPSISQERSRRNADLDLQWSILDFGLSWVRAQQGADRYLIAREKERKAVQLIADEVRNQYWEAVSADRLLKQIGPLMQRVGEALERSRQVRKQRLDDPRTALLYQRSLLAMLRSLQELKGQLINARPELAVLIGLPPGSQFELVDANRPTTALPEIDFDLTTLERTALTRRPELIESHYRERISHQEARAALLQMLPDLSFGLGIHYDSNRYLEHSRWNQLGGQVTWNLFEVFRGPARQRVAEAEGQLARERGLALAMSILGQVHLADRAWREARYAFALAQEDLDVSIQILKETRARQQAAQGDGATLIREELNAVVAELRRDVAYGELRNALGRIYLTMGIDPLPESIDSHDIESLALAIQGRLESWQRGELDGVAVEWPGPVSAPSDPERGGDSPSTSAGGSE
jgi:outer membrane protein TolC